MQIRWRNKIAGEIFWNLYEKTVLNGSHTGKFNFALLIFSNTVMFFLSLLLLFFFKSSVGVYYNQSASVVYVCNTLYVVQ